MSNNTLRHGDVGIIKSDDLKGFKPRKSNVLAWGAVTGHSHKILPKTKDDVVEVFENEKGDLAFRVNGVAVLTHEEHATIEVGTGTYKVNQEREYNYFQMHPQRVVD